MNRCYIVNFLEDGFTSRDFSRSLTILLPTRPGLRSSTDCHIHTRGFGGGWSNDFVTDHMIELKSKEI